MLFVAMSFRIYLVKALIFARHFNLPVLVLLLPECGVTANMSALGADDSGFESLHSDQLKFLMSQTFQKKAEDFACEHCGFAVKGGGYTNHCPACLWSKHVDKFPGDRAEKCGGMMEPFKIEMEKDEFILSHRCIVCGHIKRNKTSVGDNLDVILHKK